MKQYYKETDGERVWLNGVLIHEGKQIINPTEEQILAAGYVEYVPEVNTITDEQILDNLKRGKVNQILAYDESNSVNECFIVHDGMTLTYWKDKFERSALKRTIDDFIAKGIDTYRLDLRDVGISVEIPCANLKEMLSSLEIYATECYNKTTDHIFAVNALTTTEEVIAYDYTVGYPEKPSFAL